MNDLNAFQKIPNHITLDFSKCQYASDVHAVLESQFGLPAYYGENWDALWDLLDGLFYKRGTVQIRVVGFDTLQADLKTYCVPMMEIFNEIENAESNVTFLYSET